MQLAEMRAHRLAAEAAKAALLATPPPDAPEITELSTELAVTGLSKLDVPPALVAAVLSPTDAASTTSPDSACMLFLFEVAPEMPGDGSDGSSGGGGLFSPRWPSALQPTPTVEETAWEAWGHGSDGEEGGGRSMMSFFNASWLNNDATAAVDGAGKKRKKANKLRHRRVRRRHRRSLCDTVAPSGSPLQQPRRPTRWSER